MMELGVEGMMLSPGYSYDKAPDQSTSWDAPAPAACSARSFRTEIPSGNSICRRCFRNSSWASALRLHTVGNADLQRLRLAETLLLVAGRLRRHFPGIARRNEWEKYGTESGNPKCANCMVHSGYEASSVDHTFGSYAASSPQ